MQSGDSIPVLLQSTAVMKLSDENGKETGLVYLAGDKERGGFIVLPSKQSAKSTFLASSKNNKDLFFVTAKMKG